MIENEKKPINLVKFSSQVYIFLSWCKQLHGWENLHYSPSGRFNIWSDLSCCFLTVNLWDEIVCHTLVGISIMWFSWTIPHSFGWMPPSNSPWCIRLLMLITASRLLSQNLIRQTLTTSDYTSLHSFWQPWSNCK